MRAMGTRWLMVTLGPLFVMGVAGEWGYRVENFEELPGPYNIDKGTVNLCNAMWKTFVYVDLKAED
jgi:hypothetical protein